MSSIAGKVIAITGAASGIGLATAEHLASLGAKLSLTDCSAADLENAANLISGKIGRENVHYRVADVREVENINVWIEETVELFGGLDGAVNAAGVHPRESGIRSIWDVTDDDWQFAQDVNVKGVFNCIRAQLKHMVSAIVDGKLSSGSIVVFGSNASLTGTTKLSAYTTSKHAVIGLTRAAALDAAPYHLRINAVCPGPIDTPMLRRVVPADQINEMVASIPVQRLGTTAEVVGLVCFLLSDDSSFCTGGVHVVDGGLTAT